jgi:hypothetical protein
LFDPITTADYYGLAGVFFSTHILPDVGAPTEGSPVLRIALASPSELAERTRRAAREQELAGQVLAAFGGWPLTKVVRDVGGKDELVALRNEDETPSLLVNRGDARAAAGTLALPPRSIALHPSPAAGVAVAFDAPGECVVRVKGRVADGDATCGDGTSDARAARRRVRALRREAPSTTAARWSSGGGRRCVPRDELSRGDALSRSRRAAVTSAHDRRRARARRRRARRGPHVGPAADVLADVSAAAPSNPIATADGARWRSRPARERRLPAQLAAPERAKAEIARGARRRSALRASSRAARDRAAAVDFAERCAGRRR